MAYKCVVITSVLQTQTLTWALAECACLRWACYRKLFVVVLLSIKVLETGRESKIQACVFQAAWMKEDNFGAEDEEERLRKHTLMSIDIKGYAHSLFGRELYCSWNLSKAKRRMRLYLQVWVYTELCICKQTQ